MMFRLTDGFIRGWISKKSHIEEDFYALKEIGLDHLRVHLRWDLFQLAMGYIPELMLKKMVIR